MRGLFYIKDFCGLGIIKVYQNYGIEYPEQGSKYQRIIPTHKEWEGGFTFTQKLDSPIIFTDIEQVFPEYKGRIIITRMIYGKSDKRDICEFVGNGPIYYAGKEI